MPDLRPLFHIATSNFPETSREENDNDKKLREARQNRGFLHIRRQWQRINIANIARRSAL